MSKRDEPIRDWSAPDYLRDFINTHLILTFEEEEIIDYLYDQYRGLPVEMPKPKLQKYRLCQRCGELKNVECFDGKNTICRECRRVDNDRKRNRKNNKN